MRRGRAKEYLKGTRRHGAYRFPMTKFLFSRIGQLWDEVHSELSSEFDRRTYAGYAFWRNFGRWHSDVATKCWIGAETGTIYNSGNGYSIDTPVEGFYVDPSSGMLCYQKREIDPKKKPKPIVKIRIDDYNGFEKIEGIWFRLKYRLNPYYLQSSHFIYHHADKFEMVYSSKRQISTKELRALNIKNDDASDWQMKICEVCRYIDYKSIQRCRYCETLKVWLCDQDQDYRRDYMRSAQYIAAKREHEATLAKATGV